MEAYSVHCLHRVKRTGLRQATIILTSTAPRRAKTFRVQKEKALRKFEGHRMSAQIVQTEDPHRENSLLKDERCSRLGLTYELTCAAAEVLHEA